jgi:glycerophosphoryl diester phosphodiesterase
MKQIISLLIVLVSAQSILAADTKKQNELAALLSRYLPVSAQSVEWKANGDFLEVSAYSGQTPVRAAIHDPSLRVLEVSTPNQLLYKWQGIKVVGHRATMLLAPENTVAAIKKAQQLGVDIMELDVRQTKDGHLVIMHDASINRTTNGKGNVKDLTLAQIKTFDAGIKFSEDFKGEPVPTLTEALKALKDGGTVPDIDFKAGDLKLLKKTLEDAGFPENNEMTFSGSNSEYKEINKWNTLLIRPSSGLASITLGSVIKEFQPTLINVSEFQHTQSYLKNIHKQGVRSFVNVILNRMNEEARLRDVVKTLPDYIQTDRPDYLVPYLENLGLH